MKLAQLSSKHWGTPSPLPKLSDRQWGNVNLLGVVLVVMAVCQLVTFNDFKDVLNAIGLGGPTAWAISLIVAELWAAVTFFKVRLSSAFRLIGSLLAILVAGFWFVENLHLISAGASSAANSGFFGRYLEQAPGWWTAVEVTVLLFWTVYAVNLTKNSE